MRTVNLKSLNTILEPEFPSSYRVHLLVLNSPVFSKHTLSLLAGADSVYCADGGANRLLALMEEHEFRFERATARWVIGDLDSAKVEVLERLRVDYGFEVKQLVDLDSTDLQKCLNHFEQQHTHPWAADELVVIEGVFGGRFDQSFAALAEGFKRNVAPAMLLFLGGENMCCVVPAGETLVLLPAVATTGAHGATVPSGAATTGVITDVVGLLPLLPCASVTTEGFRWNLKDSSLAVNGIVSSSNEVLLGGTHVKIKTDSDLLLYMQLN